MPCLHSQHTNLFLSIAGAESIIVQHSSGEWKLPRLEKEINLGNLSVIRICDSTVPEEKEGKEIRRPCVLK